MTNLKELVCAANLSMMKILTWNINGIRSLKVPLKDVFDALDADIICMQETKVTRDQLDEKSCIMDGYSSYFSFSRARSGYSGVATFVKDSFAPIKAEEGLTGKLTKMEVTDRVIGCYGDTSNFTEDELMAIDNEGRAIITQHKLSSGKLLTVINVYCPRADPEKEDRKDFKLRFYEILQIRSEALLQSGSHVIVLGDVNTSHRKIDHCDPADDKEFYANPGRQWLDSYLYWPSFAGDKASDNNVSDSPGSGECNQQGHWFVDTFRYFYPYQKEAFTCWRTSTGAREFNYGTRIDYIFTDKHLVLNRTIEDCRIMPEVNGSDHCPVKAILNLLIQPATRCPSLCTKYLPEFSGRQQKLLAYLSKKQTSQCLDTEFTPSSQACNSSISNLESKRTAAETLGNQAKKSKTISSKGKTKQKSLMSFLNVKTRISKNQGMGSEDITNCSENENYLNPNVADKEETNNTAQTANIKNAWQNLLKGPKPGPMCKGHNEPCVLRTVKKDSLNKGRQFYVCARGEGPKTNPECRCNHFEWVEKKNKLTS